MRNLMILFLAITVLLVPIMIIYSYYGGALDSYGLNINFLHLEKTMLGNIG